MYKDSNFKRIYVKAFILCLVSLLSYCSSAYSNKAVTPSPGRWYLGGNAGASFFDIKKGQFIGTGAGWPDDYYANDRVDASGLLSFSGGYTWATHRETWLPFYSLGLSYSWYFPATVKGRIFQYSLPLFENYNYHYKIKSETLLVTAKGNIFRYRNAMPYFVAGLGAAFNHTNSYTESPLTPNITPRLSPGFHNSTSNHFSYLLGAGFDYIIKNNLWVGLGYNYNYLGHVTIGPGQWGYLSESLTTKLTNNSVVFNVNYFFDAMEQ